MSQSSSYQYPPYLESNNPLKNSPQSTINGQSSAPQQNGVQSPNFNLTGTPSSQSSRDPSRETSRDPSPTQYLHNQYRPQLPRPPMPPINAPQASNVLPPSPKTSQSYNLTNTYGVHSQYAVNTHPNVDVGTSSAAFMFQPSQEIHHKPPTIPTNQMAPPIAKNLTSESRVSTSTDTSKSIESAKLSQSYQWATNPPPANIPQGVTGISSGAGKTSQLSADQTTGSQALFVRTSQNLAYDRGHSIPPPSSNVSLSSPNVTQHSNQDNHALQDPESFGTQSPRTWNVHAQSPAGPSESSINPQLRYGSQQNIFNATSTPTTSSGMQKLFFNSQQSYTGTRNPQDYCSPPYKSSQNLLTGQMEPAGLGNVTQGPNIYQNITSQERYPQQDTANTTIPPSRTAAPYPGINQLYTRSPPSGMLPPPGNQTYVHDASLQYPAPMTNVPLDTMNRRYPNMYPNQLNQLSNEMTNLNVTQSGYNKIWNMELIDLLQNRNVLPPEKVEPPKIRLNQEFLDSINCSPEIFRCTLTKIPESNALLQKSRLPFGVLIHPFKDLNHLPVIHCSSIVRCRTCRTYINPFVSFDMRRWKCNLCFRMNELPEEFQFDPLTKSYGDPSRRPEIKNSTIEFIAPGEYMLRPPQPAVYLFVVDVSRLAVESGYLQTICSTLTDQLLHLPGDSRTQIGFLAVDSALHFFSMPDNVSQPHEMIMLDIDDVFLPCPENLIVNLKEREELIRDLLAQLPTKFRGTHDTNCALGAALQASYKLLYATGGRVTVFQTCLPNRGPGALQAREDPNARAGKDVPHLNPATDFYKRFALDCSGQQIAIDLFLLNSQYSDLATLSCMTKFTGGCIYHLPLFRASRSQSEETLERTFRRYLTRKIGFEAVMRIRCTRGLSISAFHGSFFVRSTDLLCLPNVNPDAGFGMQISIEENISDAQNVCFQAALLYTSSKGERKIRVHTLCLPIVASLSEVLHSADQQCIVGLLSKMAVDRSLQSSLSDARDALINVAIDVLYAFKLTQTTSTRGLVTPTSLQLLPMYIIALLKSMAFRSGTSTRLDDRIFAMFQLKILPLTQLIQMIYPDLYPLHKLDDRNYKEIDGRICPQSRRLHLSAEKLESPGVFLMDAGDKIFIYVCRNVSPIFCSNVFGVPEFASIPEEFYELPELDTIDSNRVRNFVLSLQEEKPFYVSVQIIRDDSHFKTLFVERLIEDRFESALSYHEFLQHLKTQVKE